MVSLAISLRSARYQTGSLDRNAQTASRTNRRLSNWAWATPCQAASLPLLPFPRALSSTRAYGLLGLLLETQPAVHFWVLVLRRWANHARRPARPNPRDRVKGVEVLRSAPGPLQLPAEKLAESVNFISSAPASLLGSLGSLARIHFATAMRVPSMLIPSSSSWSLRWYCFVACSRSHVLEQGFVCCAERGAGRW